MRKIKIIKPTLNKFHFRLLPYFLVSLFPCFLASLLPCFSTSPSFETIVKPGIASQGDTVSVKIEKLPGEKDIPKIYFEKTKVPVFSLSENWYRTLLPISANCKPGTYPIE